MLLKIILVRKSNLAYVTNKRLFTKVYSPFMALTMAYVAEIAAVQIAIFVKAHKPIPIIFNIAAIRLNAFGMFVLLVEAAGFARKKLF
ncbi:hypothetical protein F5Y10DRAFT_243712 [Nemania abortiva]|nr:hypothetical protein F5Y10DRAFT_243712 [Nemania abortiva]